MIKSDVVGDDFMELNINKFIRSMELQRDNITSFGEFPFSLSVVRNLFDLQFHPKVTFIIGENGTGKSTILEAIATAYGFNPEGGTKNFNFSSMDTHSNLHNYIRIVKGAQRPQSGFFCERKVFIMSLLILMSWIKREVEPRLLIPMEENPYINNPMGKHFYPF